MQTIPNIDKIRSDIQNTPSIKEIDDMFLQHLMGRSERIHSKLEQLSGLKLSDWTNEEELRNAYSEHEVEILREVHNYRYPPEEVWTVKKSGAVVGSFKIDAYSVIIDE